MKNKKKLRNCHKPDRLGESMTKSNVVPQNESWNKGFKWQNCETETIWDLVNNDVPVLVILDLMFHITVSSQEIKLGMQYTVTTKYKKHNHICNISVNITLFQNKSLFLKILEWKQQKTGP